MSNYVNPQTVSGAFSALSAFFSWLQNAGGGAYKRFFNGANVGLCIVNLEGEFVRVNDAFCELVAFKREHLVGTKFMRLVVLEDRQKTMQTMAELREGAEVRGFSNRYERGDGKTIALTWWSIVVGKEIFAVAMGDDV